MSLLARKLVRDGRRQWSQLGAVALTLALAVAVFGASYDAYGNLKASYAEVYDQLHFADLTVTGGNAQQLATALDAIDGISAVERRDQGEVPFRVQPGGTSGTPERTLLGRVVAQPRGATIDELLIQEGTGPGESASSGTGVTDTGVTVEQHMADHFELAVGDTVDVYGPDGWQTLPIVGIAISPEYLWPARDRQDVLSSPDDFGVLFATPELVARLVGASVEHQTLIRYAPGVNGASVEAHVRQAATAAGAGDVMAQRDQPSKAALDEDVQGFGEIAVLFPLLFLVAGALAAYVLLGRMVRSQRAQLGMLAANGYPKRRLLRHYLAFGAATGAVGSVVGALGGLWLARWITIDYTSSLHIPLAVSRFRPLTPLIGVAVGTLAGTVAAAGPARAAIGVPPAEAMHGIAPVAVAGKLLEHVPGLRGLPVRVRMLVRNVLRSPRRTFSTGIGVILASVLILSSLALLDTFQVVLDEQFHTVQREDVRLYTQQATPDMVDAVSQVEGVAAAEPSSEAPVTLTAGDNRYQTELEGFEPDTQMHRFSDGLPSSGIVLGRALRSVLDVDVGDEVSVAAGGTAPTQVEVAGFVDEPIGSLAYATLDQAAALSGSVGTSSVLARYEPGTDRTAVEQRLAALPGVLAVRDTRASEETVSSMLGFFYAIVGVMLAFGAVLAFVIVYNTLAVNLSERTVELATLRAAGARSNALARLVTAENALLVVAAIPLGLLAGWAVATGMMSTFNSDLWNFSVRFQPSTPFFVVTALLVTTLITHVPARRNLHRLAVAKIVRERAT